MTGLDPEFVMVLCAARHCNLVFVLCVYATPMMSLFVVIDFVICCDCSHVYICMLTLTRKHTYSDVSLFVVIDFVICCDLHCS